MYLNRLCTPFKLFFYVLGDWVRDWGRDWKIGEGNVRLGKRLKDWGRDC